jgi:hypothetical protein
MTPGGVLACVYPDGARVRSALAGRSLEGGRFGHFRLEGDAAEKYYFDYVVKIQL